MWPFTLMKRNLAVLFFPSVDFLGCNFADKGLFVLHFEFFVVLPGRSRIVKLFVFVYSP